MQGPAEVKAGEQATFSVTLDQPPNFEGGRVYAEFEANDKPVLSTAFAVFRSTRTYTDNVVNLFQCRHLLFSLGRGNAPVFFGQIEILGIGILET